MEQQKTTEKKILIIENSTAVTGAFKAAFNMAQVLEQDFGFVFLFPKGSTCTDIVRRYPFTAYESRYPLVSKRLFSLLSFVPNALLFLILLGRIIRKERIAIIHLNDLYNFIPYIIKIFFPALKIVTHVRFRRASLPVRYYDFLIKLALKYADQVVGVSDVVLKDSPLLDNHHKALRIYDGCTLQEKIPYKYHASGEGNKIKVLYLANYTEGKGQEEMLLALEEVVKQRSDIMVTFAGDDFGLDKNRQYKEKLYKIASQKGLGAHVTFLPRVDDVESLYKDHQLFVNLSALESFSFTCLEALYYGIPCIAYNSGGPFEILAGGEYGILLERKDPITVATALVELANDENRRVLLSEKGRVYVKKTFSSDNNQLFKDIYDTLLL